MFGNARYQPLQIPATGANRSATDQAHIRLLRGVQIKDAILEVHDLVAQCFLQAPVFGERKDELIPFQTVVAGCRVHPALAAASSWGNEDAMIECLTRAGFRVPAVNFTSGTPAFSAACASAKKS